ncbi:MAG: 6,7-dimethyl-8-ribityllumazine synthase [Roseivirga sp.]|jgi:6,7-dimethyl-8-ribityllumazine synthase
MATTGNNLSQIDPGKLPRATDMRFACVVSEWNHDITNALYLGAKEALQACGAAKHDIHHIPVPGAVELSFACKKLCEGDRYDAIIAIGNVIQGETKHFDFVCQSVTHGITELNIRYNTPVIFCVLTDNNKQQSIDRSGGIHGNKGVEAAVAALKMAGLCKTVLRIS